MVKIVTVDFARIQYLCCYRHYCIQDNAQFKHSGKNTIAQFPHSFVILSSLHKSHYKTN